MSAARTDEGQAEGFEAAEMEATEKAAAAARRQYADALTRAREARARVEELEGAAPLALDAELRRSITEIDGGASRNGRE